MFRIISLKSVMSNLKISWMLVQCLERQVPGFWKRGLISLYLILKSLEKFSLETKESFKTTITEIMVDVVSNAREGHNFYKQISLTVLKNVKNVWMENFLYKLRLEAWSGPSFLCWSILHKGLKIPGTTMFWAQGPFGEMYKCALAPWTQEKARRRKCLQMALPFSDKSSRRLRRVERGKLAHF